MADGSSSERGVAVLSIRPEYAKAILHGSKRVEFRRVSFRRWITHALIYATAPVSQVVGAFSVKAIHRGSPDEIWKQFGNVGGISLGTFRSYYEGSSVAVAIEVAEVRQFEQLRSLDDFGLSRAPQSFAYLQGTVGTASSLSIFP